MVKSPLRVCPLGAHVDHQHGLVTGMALDAAVNLVYSRGDNGYVRVQSLDFPDEEYFAINSVPGMVPGFWGNYLRGAILALKQNHVVKHGINGIISGKLPIGGLSSSAAVTTAYLMDLCDVHDIEVSKEELVHLRHWVENQFIKLNNGIVDQAANYLSRNDYLMFMDTRTGQYQLIEKPASMPELEVVISINLDAILHKNYIKGDLYVQNSSGRNGLCRPSDRGLFCRSGAPSNLCRY